MDRTLHVHVSWMQWLVAALPFWLLMTPILFAILWRCHRPELDRIEGGRAMIGRSLAQLGPMTGAEKRTLVAGLLLLG
ncbi:MAG TPA: anion permease, partial [Marmoricola sp.]|nr:anion permease [Marmoricola sp.]